MSYNCYRNRGHVQSMIWATDSVGLSIILSPAGIGECFPSLSLAVEGEVRTTQLLRDKGYEVDVFLSVYHSKDKTTEQGTLEVIEETSQDANKTENPEAIEKEVEAEVDHNLEDTPYNANNTSTLEYSEEAAEEIKAELDDTLEVTKREDPGAEDKSQIPGDFWKSCTDLDWLLPGGYFGTFVHPYENLFMKSHRGIEDNVLDRLTEWHNGRGYSSYDFCY